MARITAAQAVAKARYYLGYEEKASMAYIESFHANRGHNNYQKFQQEVGAGNGSYWCQYFIDGIFFEACGSIADAKATLRMPQSGTMSGYTPTCAGYFKAAGAWHTTPKVGDIVYFFNPSKGRIAHVGIVSQVNTASKTFTTVEGNTSSSQYSENGGCVASHTYSYMHVGGGNRVAGFGRPAYKENQTKPTPKPTPKPEGYSFNPGSVRMGSKGNHVLLLQEILRARGFKGKDKKQLGLDKEAGENTVHAINAYQAARRKAGVELGTAGKNDGECGPKMWSDLLAL